ncbi:MAG TPA: SUMF1/EgtB/PvdO family nonheme iron enzyme, partial [Polyangiaceae bacterium]|nr:SUMF1/EgtB/PvdO family nonheme iron enzyme [Polyangiaceae bacterium]
MKHVALALLVTAAGCTRAERPAASTGASTGPAPIAEASVAPSSSNNAPSTAIGDAGIDVNAPLVAIEIPGMIRVPAGTFSMGAESGGQEDERPAHVVTLAAYWLDTTEVTNEAYE